MEVFSEEELLRFIDFLHERLTDGNLKPGELDELLVDFENALHHSHDLGNITDSEYGYIKTQFMKIKFKLYDLGLSKI